MDSFSIYYRVLDEDMSQILTTTQFNKIVNNQQNLFFKYDINTEEIISNPIIVQLSEMTTKYVQLFANNNLEQYMQRSLVWSYIYSEYCRN